MSMLEDIARDAMSTLQTSSAVTVFTHGKREQTSYDKDTDIAYMYIKGPQLPHVTNTVVSHSFSSNNTF